LAKKATSVTSTESTLIADVDYLGGFQYQMNQLSFFPTAEGYVSVVDGNKFNYVFNYTDHLGNIRLSYTQSGTELKILEENHYYPFGLKHSNYNTDIVRYKKDVDGITVVLRPTERSEYQYKYNGKELQDELGLNMYDFGWRNYDPAIGRFLRIDRFAEKYMERTPYNYAANNPVYYVDVAGDSLFVTHRKGFLGLGGKETLRYENGNLLNKDGSAYAGKVKGFLKKTVEALGELGSTQEGSSIINELESSTNNFTVVKSSENSFTPDNVRQSFGNNPELAGLPGLPTTGSGGTIGFNPNTTTSGLNTSGNTSRPAFIGLGHEMAHGRDSNRGLSYPTGNFNSYNGTHQGLFKTEWRAVYIENIIRGQAGLPLRTHYGTRLTASGPQPIGPKLLDASNNPINYP